MKKLRNIAIIILVIALITIVGGISYYNYNLSPIGKNKDIIEVEIPTGTSKKKVAKILKSKKLIRNENVFMLYLKIYKNINIKAGFYDFNQSMSVKELTEKLNEGSKKNPNEIQITFKEGINIREVAQIISSSTNNKYDDVINQTKETAYLDKLINKYWFVTDAIKNESLYYGLEGYLFPDTYRFENKDVSIETIFEKMLNEMDKVLTPYKEQIQNKNVHEIITLASVIEKEGKKKDFEAISSVFNNRLKINMALQSCATAYYGKKLEFNELGIANGEVVSAKNPYNTYQINGLPIGPISLPSKDAIIAAITPQETEYLYFLSDNQGVTYFFKTYSEHQQKQKDLQAAGKWYR